MTPYDYPMRECEVMKKILATLPIGICYIHNRTIVWGNEFLIKLLGYTFDETIGKNTRMFYESNEEYERVGKELYPGKAGVITSIVTKDGKHKRVILHAISNELVSESDMHISLFPHVVTVSLISENVEKMLTNGCTP